MSNTVESRQQPGYACEECRKKKLRCDRQRPQCGYCMSNCIPCHVHDQRTPRITKKGNIPARRRRSVPVEQQLSPQSVSQTSQASFGNNSSERFTIDLGWDTLQFNGDPTTPSSASTGRQALSQCFPPSISRPDVPLSPESLQSSRQSANCGEGDVQLSEYMKADLTQIYFDRIHPNMPILCQSKAYSWISEGGLMNKYRRCLQYAIWTSASASSAQFDGVRHSLYAKTRSMLDALDWTDGDMTACQIEHIQSWTLIVFFEFAKTTYRRGWLSAGRLFRLVQLLRLYEMDDPKFRGEPGLDAIDKEERRRAFWVAYCLDRLVSVSNGTPVTLCEEVVSTRLPCLDADFQLGHIKTEHFLSEAIASVDLRLYSPLAECAILVTVSSRALTHKQVSDMELIYGCTVPRDFSVRHAWLSSMLTRRLESLHKNYPSPSLASDPMIMFAYMVALTTQIALYCIMEPFSGMDDCLPKDSLQKGLSAAQEIACLAKTHMHVGYFKMHTFTPLPIFLSVVKLMPYLDQRRKAGHMLEELEPIEKSLQASLDALHKLRAVSSLAEYYLGLLDGKKDLVGRSIND